MFPSSILGAAAEIQKFYKFLENFNDSVEFQFHRWCRCATINDNQKYGKLPSVTPHSYRDGYIRRKQKSSENV